MKDPVSEEVFDNYIESQIGTFDGKNSERIINYVQKLLESKY